MTKFRCFADVPELKPGVLVLSPEESRHVVAVLRVVVGDDVLVLNGRGHEAVGRVMLADKRGVSLELSHCRLLPEPAFQTTLYVGVPKLPAMETILQKATELGVWRICPVLTAHSVVKLPAEKQAAKLDRWNKILMAAVKQCRNPRVPELLPVTDMAGALDCVGELDLSIVGSLEEGALSVKDLVASSAPLRVGLWIGPEGDFSREEYAALHEKGVRAVSFGERILRAETAVVVALAILNYELERA